MKYICLIVLVFFSPTYIISKHPDLKNPQNIKNVDFILSPQRSGTNWTTACLQVLTQRPIRLPDRPWETETLGLNRLNLTFKDHKRPYYRTHYPHRFLTGVLPKKNRILMLLRNYKECLSRNPETMVNTILTKTGLFDDYISALTYFDKWKSNETKLLIYYEDLIQHPKESLKKILSFFQEESSRLDEFMENYDYWRDRVLQSCNKQNPSKGISGGDKPIYHSIDIPLETLHKIDNHIQKSYPDLWKKYLNLYKT